MNHPEKTNRAPKNQITRRHFLKVTGTIVLVTGTGCTFATNSNSPARIEQITRDSKYPASDGYILVDTKKCQGCVSCMLACSLVHEGVESQSLSRIQIMENPFKPFPDDLTIEQCRQCTNPVCVEDCPTDALGVSAEFGNVRMVNKEECIGCGACMEACPFTPARSFVAADETYNRDLKARKCDLCAKAPYHWDEKGGGPDGKQACVSVCPVGAIQFSRKIPVQEGDGGYKVNLRNLNWKRLGYPIG